MTDTMLQQINDAIFKRLHRLTSRDGCVIKNLHKKYDDIEVTNLSKCTQICFEYDGTVYSLNMNKLDEEELLNVETVSHDLYVKYEFLGKLDAINYPGIVTSRSRHLESLVSSLDYYRGAYAFVLDLAKSEKEDAKHEE